MQAILHTPNPPGPILMPIWISNTAAVPVDTRHHTKRAPAPPTSHHLQRVVAMPRVTSLSPRPLFHLPPPPALAQCTMPAGLQITKQTPTLSSTPLIQIQVRNYFTDTLKMYFITVYWTVIVCMLSLSDCPGADSVGWRSHITHGSLRRIHRDPHAPCSTPSDISGPPTPVHTSSPLRTHER